MSENKLLLIIVAILLPPLAVALKDGIGTSLVINIVLTLLFYIPGLIHALMVVL
ncbi:MAG: YqaE/Pmp3 family membrane protein [Luteolibacter sp.]